MIMLIRLSRAQGSAVQHIWKRGYNPNTYPANSTVRSLVAKGVFNISEGRVIWNVDPASLTPLWKRSKQGYLDVVKGYTVERI